MKQLSVGLPGRLKSIRFGCKVFVSYLIGMNHPGVTSVAILIGTSMNLLLLWLLMPILGLNGAAWATTIGYLASSTLLTFFFWKKSDMSMLEIWRFRRSNWALLGQFLTRLRRQRGERRLDASGTGLGAARRPREVERRRRELDLARKS